MPDYSKKIVVEGIEFAEILSIFSNLVQDKFFKPIPYKDYTRMRKFNKEVEFRFCPSDGAVIIVPTEPGISLLYWSKKGDNSFADFLWGHFEEELKDMHPDEKPIYDLFGLATKAESGCYDCSKVSAMETKIECYDDLSYGYADTASTSDAAKLAVTTIDNDYYSNKAAVDGICSSYLSYQNPYAECVEEIASLEEKVEHTKKKVKEYKEELQEKLDRKVSIEELDYILKESRDDLLDVIDESRYDICQLYDRIDELEKRVESVPQVTTAGTSSNVYPVKNYKIDVAGGCICDTDNRKEKESMDTSKMFNFDFGPVASHIRMSPYGLAMKNADGKYVSYDKATGSIMDVEIFNFDAQKFLYKMPVAIDAIAVGDIVVHMRKAMFVRAVSNSVVSVIDIFNGEVKDIVPTKSPFGFNFITKVVSLIDMSGASANSPFGNMLPLMMMGEGKDFKDILPMMFLANGNANEMLKNPILMYALMGENKDMLPFLIMAGTGANPFASAHKCGCPNHNPNPENGNN